MLGVGSYGGRGLLKLPLKWYWRFEKQRKGIKLSSKTLRWFLDDKQE